MIKYAEFQKINNQTLEISEKTLLDNFAGLTNGGSLLSTYDKTDVIWDYVKTTNAFGQGTVPTDRDDAERIRYGFGFGFDIDTIAIRINDNNNDHPALKKIAELKEME
jgi:hypothetical protein